MTDSPKITFNRGVIALEVDELPSYPMPGAIYDVTTTEELLFIRPDGTQLNLLAGGGVTSVNGSTGVVVLGLNQLNDTNIGGVTEGQYIKRVGGEWVNADPPALVPTLESKNGGEAGSPTPWSADADVVRLLAGADLFDNPVYNFTAPDAGVADGHKVTLVNAAGDVATIKGMVGADVSLPADQACTLIYSADSWYPVTL